MIAAVQELRADVPRAALAMQRWAIYPDGLGHYALGSPDGAALRDGQDLEIHLGGHWVAGSIEQRSHTDARFVSFADQSVCGLCPGMQVRLLSARQKYTQSTKEAAYAR